MVLDDLDTVLEDQVDVQLGKCFLVMTTEQAQSSMTKELKQTEGKIKELQAQVLEYNKILSELKKDLYVKFGDKINLEE